MGEHLDKVQDTYESKSLHRRDKQILVCSVAIGHALKAAALHVQECRARRPSREKFGIESLSRCMTISLEGRCEHLLGGRVALQESIAWRDNDIHGWCQRAR